MGLPIGTTIAGVASKNLANGFQTRSQIDADRLAAIQDLMNRALLGDAAAYDELKQKACCSATETRRRAGTMALQAVDRARAAGSAPPPGKETGPEKEKEKQISTSLAAGIIGALALGVALARPK